MIAPTCRIATLCLVVLLVAPARVHAVQVLPPGQEDRIEALLGAGILLAGCRYEGAGVEQTRVKGTWRCGDARVGVTLGHASAAHPDDTIAGAWALSAAGAPAPFVAALAARMRAFGPTVTWQDVQAVTLPPGAPPETPQPAGTPPKTGMAPMSPEAEAVYRRSEALMSQSRVWEMLEELEALVRREPHPLLMGRVVVAGASRVSQPDGIAWVDERMRQADAHPEDLISQFVTGVAVHYRGHGRGESREAKVADYERALHFLERVKDAYASSPRLWIYLAVSYLRTGRQAEAEAAIENAVAHDDGGDADIYYCRAEVWHRKDPRKALADIERYQATMRRNKAGGAWAAPEKEGRVEAMRQTVARVASGEASWNQGEGEFDLFDPVKPGPAVLRQLGESTVLVGAASVLFAILAAWALWHYRRPRNSPRSS